MKVAGESSVVQARLGISPEGHAASAACSFASLLMLGTLSRSAPLSPPRSPAGSAVTSLYSPRSSLILSPELASGHYFLTRRDGIFALSRA